MNKVVYLAVASALAVTLTGCGTPINNTQAGSIAGAVAGGVLGHQVGKGDGRTLATVAGTVAGGYIGGQMGENQDRYYQNQQPAPYYRPY